jgi:hypothetical protein
MSKQDCVSLIRDVMNQEKRTGVVRPSFSFGMHKGGSTMLADFLNIYTGMANTRSISISDLLFQKGVGDDMYRNDLRIQEVLDEKFLFYGFRYIPEFILANKAKYINTKAVILIRDPRDCVVSAYYSFLKSHVVLAGDETDAALAIRKEREEFACASINEYALSETVRFVQEISGYAYFMHENAMIFRYEDIIFKKREFFMKVVAHLGLPIHEKAFETALGRVDILPAQEQKDKHIRSVKPGNHREKLSQETIAELNRKYSEVLSLFGYY